MIEKRQWVTGGVISGVTTVVIAGLLLATHPRGDEPAPDPSALVASGEAAGLDLPLPPETDVVAATRSASKPTAKPSATATASKAPKVKPVKAAAQPVTAKPKAKAPAAKAGGSKSGVGRIQFGRKYTGRATFYAATGAGNCSFEASSNLMVAAMNQQDYENSQACGAHVKVTGPNGTVTVRIVDRCPECPPGAIDLSRQAFEKIAPVSAGRVSISWRLLSPGSLGNVGYRYKTGSTQYWCAIQVRDHRNPVRSLKVKTGGTWKALRRENFNYFISDGGAGCGGAIRITDIYGNQLTDSGIKISPDRTQRGRAQFPAAG